MNYIIIERDVFVNDVIWKVTDNGGLTDISMIQAAAVVGLRQEIRT